MKSFIFKLVIGLAVLFTLLILGNGVIFKTFEGEMSQGVSESTRWFFSVKKDNTEIIEQLNNVDGRSVKLTYLERYFTFPWVSDTKYFITKVDINEGIPALKGVEE